MSCKIQPARHNHSLTGHQMNQPGLCVPKKAYFWPNLAFLGPKILIFMGGSKIFGTHLTEKPPRHLFRIVFWSGMGLKGPKMPISGPNAYFGRNLAVFGTKFLISTGGSKSFGTNLMENHLGTLFASAMRPNGPKIKLILHVHWVYIAYSACTAFTNFTASNASLP